MIELLPIGLLGSNCYLIFDREGGEGAVADPGVADAGELLHHIAQHRLHVGTILNTHGHFDHVAGNGRLDLPDARLGIHPDDAQLLRAGGGAAAFGLPQITSPAPDFDLTDGMELSVGELRLRVIHTPGHTPGSVCLYLPADAALITGDTLFAGSVGRTDLPGGSTAALMRSLARLLELPPETRIYPGHGPTSTLREERRNNPWLRRL